MPVERAVAEALAHNPSVVAARAAARAAGAEISAERAAFLPRVTAAESWQRSNEPVFVFGALLNSRRFAAPNFAIDALNHPDPIALFHTTVGVEQIFFDGGRTASAVDAAVARGALANHGADDTASEIALQTTQAYGRLLVAQAARRSTQAALASAQQDVERGRNRRDAGTLSDADVLSLEADLADLQQRAIQAAGDEAIARAVLNTLMGSALDHPLVAVEPAAATAEPAALESLYAEAEMARPELKRAEEAARLARAGARQSRAAWTPQVVGQAAYELNGTSFAERATGWVFGGELRWSFSTGGAELARSRASADAVARAEAELDTARATLRRDVFSARTQLVTARARRAAASTRVAQALESQRIIRDRFEAGLAGVNDVLRAEAAVLDADRQRTAVVADLLGAEAALRRSVGTMP